MIVPSMTLAEIRKALVYDYEHGLHAKEKGLEIIAQGKWMRGGKIDFTETVLYTSQSKNNWRIIVQCEFGLVSVHPYLISHDHTGITASQFLFTHGTDKLMYFNTHFFKRYKERAKINSDKPQELVKNFFKKNPYMLPSYYPMEDGSQQLFCALAGGIGLGKYHEEGGIHEFKTFVDNSLLKQNQLDKVDQLYNGALEQAMADLKKFRIK